MEWEKKQVKANKKKEEKKKSVHIQKEYIS